MSCPKRRFFPTLLLVVLFFICFFFGVERRGENTSSCITYYLQSKMQFIPAGVVPTACNTSRCLVFIMYIFCAGAVQSYSGPFRAILGRFGIVLADNAAFL